jgi:hypothetical protein
MKGYRESNPRHPSMSRRLTSNPTEGGGGQAWRGSAIGGSPELHSRALWGTVTRGFWGKTTQWSVGSLPEVKCSGERLQGGSRWRLPYSEHGRRWAAAPALFQLQEAAQRFPHGLLLPLRRINGSNRWHLAQIWWWLGFSGFHVLRVKIRAMGCTIYRCFW